MQLTKKQTEFWALIVVVCLFASVIILLVDLGIKSAILEESNRLRLKIEEWEIQNGRGSTQTVSNGIAPDIDNNNSVSPDVLVDNTPGMETANVSDGTTEAIRDSANGRTKASRSTRPRGVSPGNK